MLSKFNNLQVAAESDNPGLDIKVFPSSSKARLE